MFAVFADQTCTANIYTHKYITCMHAAERLLSAKIKSAKVISLKYTRYIELRTPGANGSLSTLLLTPPPLL